MIYEREKKARSCRQTIFIKKRLACVKSQSNFFFFLNLYRKQRQASQSDLTQKKLYKLLKFYIRVKN